ncbi:MAG TPA: hypothetical protein HA364_02705 [Thermoplasmata archaeon]|nr:hypothetical protein [Thermoplasmata archaeon]
MSSSGRDATVVIIMHGPGETDVEAWTRTVSRGEAKALMDTVLAEAKASGAEILMMDGAMVFGTDHVKSAFFHATKATAEGRNSSESLAMETLLYASGERQLSSAIRKMAVGDATESVVVAVLKGHFSPREGWSKLPRIGTMRDRAKLAGFGITEREMSTVTEERLTDLVLEKVAAVDVIKK